MDADQLRNEYDKLRNELNRLQHEKFELEREWINPIDVKIRAANDRRETIRTELIADPANHVKIALGAYAEWWAKEHPEKRFPLTRRVESAVWVITCYDDDTVQLYEIDQLGVIGSVPKQFVHPIKERV